MLQILNNNTLGALSTTSYRYGSGRVHFSSFTCSGTEEGLLTCQHSAPQSYCHSHYYDAGVICRGMWISILKV